MYQYLKHSFLTCLIVPAAIGTILMAPQWAFLIPMGITLINVLVDNFTPPELDTPHYKHPWILDIWVYLYVLVIGLYFFSLFWMAAPNDFLQFGAAFAQLTGIDILQSKQAAGLPGLIGCTFAVGYVLSSNHLFAHELVHRAHDRLAVLVGRCLLAMTGDAQFSISHVHAHHVHVGTAYDSATARRGESVYAFFVRSSVGQYKEAWQIETGRLRVKGLSIYGLHNRVLTGLLMSCAYAAFAAAAAGYTGLFIYLTTTFIAKFLFETVNYIEHYGVVRVPGTQVMPRHSWDCNTRFASNALLNLSRHADHHANAQKKYWELEPENTPLQLSYGYIGTIIVAIIPMWWHRFAAKQLAAWDKQSASPEEKILALKANIASKHPLFLSMARTETLYV